MSEIKNINTVTWQKCTGCGACITTCPKNCIELRSSPLGYSVAKADIANCISCGRCLDVCAQISHVDFYPEGQCYAMIPQGEYFSEHYASGGAASLLSKTFLARSSGGIVCGVTWDSRKMEAVHKFADTADMLEQFRGSLYVQSDSSLIWPELKKLLGNGREVLFIGTPCQVAAALKLFSKERNLFTVELICHGVPPQIYLQEYIKVIAPSAAKVKFRGKYDFSLSCYDSSDKLIYRRPANEDLYFSAFLKGVMFRENCYSCLYAKGERCADITIGDFWGIDRSKLENPYDKRISLVIANSPKAMELIKLCGTFAIFQRFDYNDARHQNGQLNAPFSISEDHDIFVRCYNGSFIQAVKHTVLFRNLMRQKIRNTVYKFLSKLKRMILRKGI